MKSRRFKKNHKTKKTHTMKKHQKTKKICKRGCRTKDCGHTPFLYGGSGPNDFQKLDDLGQNLAYTGEKVPAISPNPHFAYVGKGGFSGKGNNYSVSDANYNLADAAAYPSAYPIVNNQYVPGNPTVNWLNSNSMSGGKRSRYSKKGGTSPPPLPAVLPSSTNSSTHTSIPIPLVPPPTPPNPPMKGGSCGCSSPSNSYGNLAPGQKGGCGQCQQKGGNGFYKNPLPYPNGLVGTAWTPKISSWPGVNGVDGDSNYYPLNTYSPVDISREMVDIGASKPFMGGGGKKTKKKLSKFKTKKYRGGNWSNSFGQDLINLGRSSFYNMNTTFNALKGVHPPTNPLPWKEQL
jgi:hypothetical protein